MLLPFAAVGLADDFKPLDTKLGLWETTVNTEGMPAMPQCHLNRVGGQAELKQNRSVMF